MGIGILSEIRDALKLLHKEKAAKALNAKQEIDAALACIDAYREAQSHPVEYLREHRNIVGVLVQALEVLSAKHKPFDPCFAAIQKVVAHGAVSEQHVEGMLRALTRNTEMYPEKRLRVLQMLLPLVQDPGLVRGSSVLELFRICVLLIQTARNQTIAASTVIVCHVVAQIFDRPRILDGPEKDVAIIDCCNILAEILEGIEKGGTLGLDLLLACVAEGGSSFRQKELHQILMGPAAEILIAQMGRDDLPTTCRVLQILKHVLEDLLDSPKDMCSILSYLSRQNLSEKGAVILEEFFYVIPYGVLSLLPQYDPEAYAKCMEPVSEIRPADFQEIGTLYLPQMNRTDIPLDPAYRASLRLTRVLSTAGHIQEKLASSNSEQRSTLPDGNLPDHSSTLPDGNLPDHSSIQSERGDWGEAEEYMAYLKRNIESVIPENESFSVDSPYLTRCILRSVSSMVSVSQLLSSPKLLRDSLLLLFSLSYSSPDVFYAVSLDLSLKPEVGACIWQELFQLTYHLEKQDPGSGWWSRLVERLKRGEEESLRRALLGACMCKGISNESLLSLFLTLVHQLEGLPDVFGMGLGRVLSIAEISKNQERASRLISCFFKSYFSERPEPRLHPITLAYASRLFRQISETLPGQIGYESATETPESPSIAHSASTDIAHIQEVSTANNALDPEVSARILLDVLSALSLGVRTSGEVFGAAWTDVYEIFMKSSQIPFLHRTVFDIVQVVTDRLLPVLPQACLPATARILCACCVSIRDSNTALQVLGCIRELLAYSISSDTPEETKEKVWNTSLCILCTMAYDSRDDVRDSAMALAFESVRISREKDCVCWKPLVGVFFRRLLGAAVYAKDREIYSGEYDEDREAPGDEEEDPECPCSGMGPCAAGIYEGAAYERDRRSVSSAKTILLSLSAIIFEYFEELTLTPGFYHFWEMLGKIFVRFSKDPEMETTVVSSIYNGMAKIRKRKYWRSMFHTIAEICAASPQKSIPPETLVQLLRFAHKQAAPDSPESLEDGTPASQSVPMTPAPQGVLTRPPIGDTASSDPEIPDDATAAVLFSGATYILMRSCGLGVPATGLSGRLSLFEFELVSALQEEGGKCGERIRINALLEWLGAPQGAASRLSSSFLAHCMGRLVQELADFSFPPSVHFRAVSVLLAYYETKRVEPKCWAKAIEVLRSIFLLESERGTETHAVWASREILGLPDAGAQRSASHGPLEPEAREKNRNIQKIMSENISYIPLVKQEERDMCDHIAYLQVLAGKADGDTLHQIYDLALEAQESALANSLNLLYMSCTRMLCETLQVRKELLGAVTDWVAECIRNYSEGVRHSRILYSRFKREKTGYVLQKIAEGALPLPSTPDVVDHLLVCAFSEDSNVSLQSQTIIRQLATGNTLHGPLID